MCRRNQILGLLAMAFGLGLMVGCWFQSELVRNCWGIILIAGGIFVLQKK